ncbi:MAG: DUF362 domain-containing protein [Armatimonadota bacterium]
MPKVAIVRCDDYEREKVQRAVAEAVALVGGIGQFVSEGERVIVKPNLLSAADPARAVTTHPLVIEAVCKLVRAAGAEAIIADSPGAGLPHREDRFPRLYDATGMVTAAERSGATLNFDASVAEVSCPQGVAVKRLDVMKPVLDADGVINVPKLKTHSFMMLTLATKNMFGIIPGLGKPGHHAKLRLADRFADMLLDILTIARPRLNVMDAVVGMEGEGPGRAGRPKGMRIILASADSIALDAVACRIVGVDPRRLPVLAAAQRRGWWNEAGDGAEVVGASIEDVAVSDFRLSSAVVGPGGLVAEKWYERLLFPRLREHLTARAVVERELCTACGTCVTACPEDAIRIVEKLAAIDDGKCIRCYCCHEVCPEAAIDLRFTWLGRFARRRGLMGAVD